MRTLVIGDIHGQLESLKGVLDLAAYNLSTDRLICVGDYIDGGFSAYEVIEFLLQLDSDSLHENIFLMGNHDKMFLDILEDDNEIFRNRRLVKEEKWEWYSGGGLPTYDSYIMKSDEEITRHKVEFYSKLKYYHEENNKLFVHAGYDFHTSIQTSYKENIQVLIWDRHLYKTAITDHSDGSSDIKLGGYDKIYIGHTPTFIYGDKYPCKRMNVINVDQGCKVNGNLTAWVDETDEWFMYEPLKNQTINE